MRPAAAFAAVYLGWGSLYLAIRFAVETLPPFLMAGTSAVIAGAVMCLWERRRGVPPPTRRQWLAAVWVGVLLLWIGNGGVVWAEQFVSSSLTTLLLATEPSWMVLIDWLVFRGERPTVKTASGIALGFAGVLLLVLKSAPGESVQLVGCLVILAAAISWSLGSLVSRRADLPASPVLSIAMPILTGGLMMLLTSALAGEWRTFDLSAVSARSAAAFVYITGVSYVLTYTAYAWLLRNVSVAKLSTYAFVNPMVAVFLGWSVGGETITPQMTGGAVLILAAVGLILAGSRAGTGETCS